MRPVSSTSVPGLSGTIEGLASIDVYTLMDNWDADADDDGLEIYLTYNDADGRSIRWDDAVVLVTFSLSVSENYFSTQSEYLLLHNDGVTVSANNQRIRIPFEDLLENFAEDLKGVDDTGFPRIGRVLLEKPLEQSRDAVLTMQEHAIRCGTDVRCNHPMRCLPVFEGIRRWQGPLQITLNSGAIGFACNGIHWIDLALYLSDSTSAKLQFGSIAETRIQSGRGVGFCDYGGIAHYDLHDGSSLHMSVNPESPAPPVTVIFGATESCVIDHADDLMVSYRRDQTSRLPAYRYGADYERQETHGVTVPDYESITQQWLTSTPEYPSPLPTLRESVIGHELLFDLLEQSGEKEFPIT